MAARWLRDAEDLIEEEARGTNRAKRVREAMLSSVFAIVCAVKRMRKGLRFLNVVDSWLGFHVTVTVEWRVRRVGYALLPCSLAALHFSP
jgi:hypothetical protein